MIFEANIIAEDKIILNNWESELIGLQINDLCFSGCGMNLVITLDDNSRPVVRSIKSAIRSLEPQKLEWSTKTCDSLTVNPSATLIPYRSQPVLRSGTVETRDNGPGMSSTMLIEQTKPRTIEIRRSFQSAEGPIENVDSLSVLPDWPNIKNTKLALTWPASKEEKIRIFVNKAAQTWYGLRDTPEENFPCIIHRDQQAVRSIVSRPVPEHSFQAQLADSALAGSNILKLNGNSRKRKPISSEINISSSSFKQQRSFKSTGMQQRVEQLYGYRIEDGRLMEKLDRKEQLEAMAACKADMGH